MLKANLIDLWLFVRRVSPNALAILLVLVLSAFFFSAMEAWPEASPAQCFVNAFYMMTVEAVEVPDLWYIEVFVFVLPLLGLLLAAEGLISATVLFFNRSQRQGEWNAVVASTYKGHYVICGLGQFGSVLCEGLHQAGIQVVVVDVTDDITGVRTARRRHIPIILGDMTLPETLSEANVQNACCVVLCSGDDLANIEAAMTAKQLNPDADVRARVHKKSLADRVTDAMNYDIEMFSPYAEAAAALLGSIRSCHAPDAGAPEPE
jgi:voltage-gated potassium channel Kch